VRKRVLFVMAIALVLTSCGGDGDGDGGGGGTREPPPIPGIDARCDEIQAAIDYFGLEHVFRTQIDDFLADDAPPHIVSQAVLAQRDLWSLCAIDAPRYAEEIAEDSPPDDSPQANVFRSTMTSQDIDAFDEGTDGGLDILGGYICNLAAPLQPITTSEIIEVIAAELIDRYGGMDALEASKVFFFAVAAYCPDLDMSGGS
jgi:hypothetical protein